MKILKSIQYFEKHLNIQNPYASITQLRYLSTFGQPSSVTFHFHCHLTFKCKTQMLLHVVHFYNICLYLKLMCNMQLFSILCSLH